MPTPVEGSSARPARRGDAILWRAFAAAALPLGILCFFLGPEAQTVIYQVFSAAALVAILVGIRRYCPARSHQWWFFAARHGGHSAEDKGATFRIVPPLAASVACQPVEEAV